MYKILLFILSFMGGASLHLVSASGIDTQENVEGGGGFATDEALVPFVENGEYSQSLNALQNVQNSVSDQQILDDLLPPSAQEVSTNNDDLENQNQSIPNDQLSEVASTRLSSSEKINQKGAALIDRIVDAYQGYAPSVVASVGGMAVSAAANTAAPGVGTVAGMVSTPLLKMGAGVATKVTGEIIRAGSKEVLSLGASGAALISKTAKSAVGQSVPSSIQNNVKRVKTKVDHAMSLAKSVLGNLTGGIFERREK